MRLDDGVCSGWFAVEQGLRQGCVLAPLPFKIFFAAVTHVAYMRFEVGKGIMDALWALEKKRGRGSEGKQRPESLPRRRHCGSSYTPAVVVSKSPEQPRNMTVLL